MESLSNSTEQQLLFDLETTQSLSIGEGPEVRSGEPSGAPGGQSDKVRLLCSDLLNSYF